MLRLALIVFALAANAAFAQSPVERGSYLVNAVMACDGCHTPRGPGGFLTDQRFSGGSQTWDEPAYKVKGSNITSDRETGIGAWSEADLKRSLVEGVRPNGTPLAPQMPFTFYRILTPRDLDALAAYIKSAPAVKNAVQAPVYKTAMPSIPGAEKPFDEAARSDPVKRGFSSPPSRIAWCVNAAPRRHPRFQELVRQGRQRDERAAGTVTVSNITSHPKSGIGAWSDAEIKRALTQGLGRDGHQFKLPMARQLYFSKMTEPNLDAIVAWLRTLPPLE